MAITIVASVAGAANNGNDVTLALAGAQQNDVVVVFGGHSNRAGQTPGVVSPSGYTSVYSYTGGDPNFNVAWKRFGATPDPSVLLNGTGNAADAASYGAYVLRGVTTEANPFDATIRTSVASGAPQSPSIITNTAGAMVIVGTSAAVNDATPGTVTNFVATIGAAGNDTGVDHSSAGATSIVSATTVSPAAWSTFTSGAYVGATVALKPSPEVNIININNLTLLNVG